MGKTTLQFPSGIILAISISLMMTGSSCARETGTGSVAFPPKITSNTVNLTVERFFSAFTSKNETERNAAELFLLGVLDATEGKSWCDYKTFKTITLRERVFLGLRKLSEEDKKKRAAVVIENILKERYPCRSEK